MHFTFKHLLPLTAQNNAINSQEAYLFKQKNKILQTLHNLQHRHYSALTYFNPRIKHATV